MPTNQELNQKLDYMFKKYGIEYHDFGFTNDMSNAEIDMIIYERELEIIDTITDEMPKSFECIETVPQIEDMLKTFPVSRSFVYGQMLGDTRKVYPDLIKAMPKDHTVKSWLALHIRWADTLTGI